ASHQRGCSRAKYTNASPLTLPMRRDPAKLAAQTFDVLVIGGGVYGLTIAYDAAQRGLSVALIEADDFGSGASFNHLRTIHGGLRYLQSLDVRRARESIRERRTLARIAPHAVQPLVFALPLTRSIVRGKLAMRAGFLVDRVIEIDAAVTVNATGPRIDRLLSPLQISVGAPLLKAMNLVTRREAGEEALGARAASGRHLFLVPWRGRALFGTWESDREATDDDT